MAKKRPLSGILCGEIWSILLDCLQHFTDADQASGYALEALRWAAENGILSGYGDGRLDPRGLATRAQVAQMLKSFLENT